MAEPTGRCSTGIVCVLQAKNTFVSISFACLLCRQVAAVHPGFGTAGSFNVSVAYDGAMKGSRSGTFPQTYRYDRTGRPYMYQTYAEVYSISPTSGSLAGGTVVTITGRGFPSLDLNLGDTLSVRLNGVQCTVTSSNYSTITCRSGPAPASPPIAYASPLGGQYPGMRGAEYEVYRNVTYSAASQAWNLNSTVTVASNSLNYKDVIMDVLESRPTE